MTSAQPEGPEDSHEPDGPHEPAELPSVHEIADEIAEVEERRYPSTIGGAFYIAVLVGAALGVAWVAVADWRTGVTWLSASLLAAAGLRLVVPTKDAGMLRVRHRLVDVLLLGTVGSILLFLARTIPDQPTL